MAEPRTPQDHQSKKSKDEPDEFFTFTSQGEQFTTVHPTPEVLGAKFVRQNRRRDEVDFVMTAFEAMVGDGPESKALFAAFDNMSRPEWEQFQKDFRDHLGATLGE